MLHQSYWPMSREVLASASSRATVTMLTWSVTQSKSAFERPSTEPTLRRDDSSDSTCKASRRSGPAHFKRFQHRLLNQYLPLTRSILSRKSHSSNPNMARFALFDPHDQSAAVWIMTFLLLSYTTSTTLVRGWVKVKMLGLDDGAAGLMQLIAFGHVVCMVYALLHGFAKTQPQTAEEVVELEYGTVSYAWKAHPTVCFGDKH